MDSPAMPPVANAVVQTLLDKWVAEGSEIGVHLVAHHGGTCVVDAWAGYQDRGKPVDPDSTLFNVFSVCKAVAATCVHIQAERGLIEYGAPLARYWPQFIGDGREQVTVRHVLTHRSGMHKLPADITVEQMCDWGYMVSLLERTAPAFAPGSVSGYQSMTFGWLLGEIV